MGKRSGDRAKAVRRTCAVCGERGAEDLGVALCARCARAYDAANERDNTFVGLIVWAAQRARRFERRRVRRQAQAARLEAALRERLRVRSPLSTAAMEEW